MQVKYGGTTFAMNEAQVKTASVFINDANDLPVLRRDTVRIKGYLNNTDPANSQTTLTNQIIALNSELTKPFQDLYVFQDDGTTLSAIRLMNTGSTSGVHIVDGPNYPDGAGYDYGSYRVYEFAMECEYPLSRAGTTRVTGPPFGGAQAQGGTSGQSGQAVMAGAGRGWVPAPAGVPLAQGIPAENNRVIMEWSETVESDGGGPLIIFLNALNGPPQEQLIYPSTMVKTTQSGFAVGLFAYPTPPAPIWPAALVTSPKVTRIDPKRKGLTWRNWRIEWRYEFGSVGFLPSALPNVWTG